MSSSRTVGRRSDNNQAILLCRRLRRWHGASFPSYIGSPALLGLLEFSDWQLIQVLVEACRFVSSQASLCPFQWVLSYRSRGRVSGTISSFSWYVDLFLSFSAPQGLHNYSLHGDGHRPVIICLTSRHTVELIPPRSQSWKNVWESEGEAWSEDESVSSSGSLEGNVGKHSVARHCVVWAW